MKNLTLSLLLIIIFLTACKSSQQRRAEAEEDYGYVSDEVRNLETVKTYSEKWEVPDESLYIIDFENYVGIVRGYIENNRRLAKDLSQWHMLMVFDSNDSLISYQINCNTKRKNNDWQWNYLGTFNQYPPQDNSVKKYHHELKFSDLIPVIKDAEGNPYESNPESKADITIVVFWTIYHGRQSENLIREVLDFDKKHKEKSVELVFLNHPSSRIINELDKEG
ncbi:hypothetical protein QYS49_04100 [Marivirga salinae]|uniref:Lipoprotein n=1 Tax=Marivirga salinarum TaxID=3059078 RepID=A0AA49J9H3_9BACT|nr:hypothetical protein [Marivirga sp. BDSF4-3]WKK76511.1 hypothetical protein QYS49_04100 [Marivirga sp. BDSF4-3]